MTSYLLRAMRSDDWDEVAALIFHSTNAWYQANGKPPIFQGETSAARLFCEVYEALDPGCCVLAVCEASGQIAGSCFYHPRSTHMSLGIMNVHPQHFGKGIARNLLAFIIDQSEMQQKPLRLVSSAMNLDSFSLYNRAGFVPRAMFQDMILQVPEEGIQQGTKPAGLDRVRPATLADLEAIVALEAELHKIARPDDHRFFLENKQGIWQVAVIDAADGNGIDGFLASVCHPGSNMLGPGVMRTEEDAAALVYFELNRQRGRMPVWLVPVEASLLVQYCYGWGAKNCELHVSQVRGQWTPTEGVIMPTFMPETS
ncbi:GNAT family N-acetyltransferase [Bremerella cremea]|uniref:GNAT family N-acetyltransferase n=1 Tax=Bremerella cremea TaxID=1031537 RepID=A0A368KY61_9BACT|nr:GNAT family N-acetyltransferase [Bremerella cremea]RCS54132.1 GNAT family N-acetyltransferase [Bremerella cremea]